MIKKWIKTLVFSAFSLAAFSSTESFANVGEAMGFGARTISLGGAGVAGGTDSYAAYHNPAGLAFQTDKRFFLNWGIAYLHPSFLPISNVAVQNRYVADGVSYGGVDLSSNEYKDTFGQMLGFSYRLFPEFLNFTFGAAAFLPLEQLARMDTGETYVPEYFLYRARTLRPQVEAGFGVQLSPKWSVGAGLHTSFSMTGNATVFMNTADNTTSTMRFAASLSPKFSPYLGTQLIIPAAKVNSLTLGAVVRFAATSDVTLPLNASARAFGSFTSLDIRFQANSALYYDPLTFELGAKWDQPELNSRTYLQLEYQMWSGYQPPALAITQTGKNCTGAGCDTLIIQPGVVPSYSYMNILVPRIGQEFQLSQMNSLRFGYAYRSSILRGVSSDNGNYLDPSKHILTAGWGLDFKKFLAFETPCRLDFAFTYQILMKQTITKSANNEAGVAGDPKIGTPAAGGSYDAGGHLVGAAVSLAFAF